MSRAFQFLGLFLLAALVAHLAYVLVLPPMAAHALLDDVRGALGENLFRPLDKKLLRRIVRHPVPEAVYGACVLQLEERPVMFTGPDLRTMWSITVYSPYGNVVYAVSDRSVPQGTLRIRFEYREVDAEIGEIALPKLDKKTLVLPLQHTSALMLLEAWPWHPGQSPLLTQLMQHLRCRPIALQEIPSVQPAPSSNQAVPIPRPRPRRPDRTQ